MPKPSPALVRVRLRLPEPLLAAVRARAAESRTPVAVLLRQIVAAGLRSSAP